MIWFSERVSIADDKETDGLVYFTIDGTTTNTSVDISLTLHTADDIYSIVEFSKIINPMQLENTTKEEIAAKFLDKAKKLVRKYESKKSTVVLEYFKSKMKSR